MMLLWLSLAPAAEVVQTAGEPVALRGPIAMGEALRVAGRLRELRLGPRLEVWERGVPILEVEPEAPYLSALLQRQPLPLDRTGLTLLRAYGAVQVGEGVAPALRFVDQHAIDAFQSGLSVRSLTLHGTTLRLQAPAAEALEAAFEALDDQGLAVGFHRTSVSDRSYAESRRYFRGRARKGLAWWASQGRLPLQDAEAVNQLADGPLLDAILAYEALGLWCHPQHDRSLLRWVAPPGTSQHHSLLAVDLDHPSEDVVRLLEHFGWYRTVLDDRDHITWLGLDPGALQSRGLRPAQGISGGYWVVDLP